MSQQYALVLFCFLFYKVSNTLRTLIIYLEWHQEYRPKELTSHILPYWRTSPTTLSENYYYYLLVYELNASSLIPPSCFVMLLSHKSSPQYLVIHSYKLFNIEELCHQNQFVEISVWSRIILS